jgi:hypothetical protein
MLQLQRATAGAFPDTKKGNYVTEPCLAPEIYRMARVFKKKKKKKKKSRASVSTRFCFVRLFFTHNSNRM